MKKKRFFPLARGAPFGFARPALGKSSGSVHQLDHIPPPFRSQSFNTRATPPFLGTLYPRVAVLKKREKKPIDDSRLPRSYYQLTIPLSLFHSSATFITCLGSEKEYQKEKSRIDNGSCFFASGPPANFTPWRILGNLRKRPLLTSTYTGKPSSF